MVITIRHLAHIATHIAAHIENHRQCVPPWRLAADEITAHRRRGYGSSLMRLRLVQQEKILRPTTTSNH